MSLAGIELVKLNENLDFEAIELRYRHKLLPGNFAIVPTRTGSCIFGMLGSPHYLKKVMTRNALFGLHWIDYENKGLKFDPTYHAEESRSWFQEQAKLNGFKEVKHFIDWR